MTAIVGAAVAVGLSLYLWIQVGNKMVPPSLYSQIPIAVIGALCTGVVLVALAQSSQPEDLTRDVSRSLS